MGLEGSSTVISQCDRELTRKAAEHDRSLLADLAHRDISKRVNTCHIAIRASEKIRGKRFWSPSTEHHWRVDELNEKIRIARVADLAQVHALGEVDMRPLVDPIRITEEVRSLSVGYGHLPKDRHDDQ